MTQVIAVSAHKGGVGKTTTAANLGASLSLRGQRVLMIDLDPMFGLTRLCGRAPSDLPATMHEVLAAETELAEAATELTDRLSLVGAHRDLRKDELALALESHAREWFVNDALDGQTGAYDIVVIDCPPNPGLLTTNALYAAEEVVVPVSMADEGAYQGVVELRAILAAVAKRKSVAIRALVRVLASEWRRVHRDIEPALLELGLPMARTQIPRSAAFENSAVAREILALAQPRERGALAYGELADELLTAPARAAA